MKKRTTTQKEKALREQQLLRSALYGATIGLVLILIRIIELIAS